MAKENEEYYNTDRELPDFRELLDSYLRYWPLFLVSVVIAVIIGLLYLRFTIPTYAASTSVIIENEEAKGPSGEGAAYADLGLLKGLSTSSIENELGLLRSKRLMLNAVKALQLNVLYYAPESFPRQEVYKQSPYLLRILRLDENSLSEAIRDEINFISLQKTDSSHVEILFPNGENSNVKLGNVIEHGFVDFVIEANEDFKVNQEKDVPVGVDIEFVSLSGRASLYQSQLEVELVEESSTLIEVRIVDEVRKRAEDILNQLIFEYNQEAIEDKNLIARNSAFFIDERLSIINSELDSVESGKEQFKASNRLTDIDTESSLIIENASDYEKKQQEVSNQLELTNAMIDHLRSNDSNLLPTNLGLDEMGTNSLISDFNATVLERNRLMNGATEKNPLVIRLTDQITQIKNNIQTSLERRRMNLRISMDNLSRQAGILGSQISEVPSQEREYRGIERQQNIKEALYLFLLQKREENSLSLAVTAPKAKLVDKAYSGGTPIAPNNKIVIAISFLLGLFLPFLAINIKRLLDNKIRSREQVRKVVPQIPLIAEIPHVSSGDSNLIKSNERSLIGESFNILSANLSYVIGEKAIGTKGKCIYVTSSTQGEGKTFTVMNLAMTLVQTGKSVVVVGADLRNPQLQRYEDGQLSTRGLSTFLAGSDPQVLNFVDDSKLHENLKLLPSGPVPPNPIQLLQNEKMEGMFNELKSIFDYVIVDTAPSMILADTFLISKYADVTLYLLRVGRTKRKVMEFALDINNQKKLKNMGFLLNDVKMLDSNYGHQYGVENTKSKIKSILGI
ncbi:GumC family protein [Zobellia alginiliquefaciens]|uniref:GumC family protein n=1 Tax=Zobellia alginiliquefaciens TaxID=3032586 RepID=UPI0023E15314|nr:polysaccharide biosynthesis tyrosine autokinase [Zobellia alginiliquefaciens]